MTVKAALTAYLIWLAIAGLIKTARECRNQDMAGTAGGMVGTLVKHGSILGGLWYCGFWA